MTGIAPQHPDIGSGETLNGGVDFTSQLDSTESITGTPTVVEETTSDLTISAISGNAAAVTINGTSVGIGKAVLFTVTGAVSLTEYSLLVTCATDASTPQTLTARVRMTGEP